MPIIDAEEPVLTASKGREDRPVLILSNSLGTTLQMWEPQLKALTQVFRVLRYDSRGHGQSDAPPGPYTIELLRPRRAGDPGRPRHRGRRCAACPRAAWSGTSLGANAPERFDKIVLANTTTRYRTRHVERPHQGGEARPDDRRLADAVLAGGLTADFREREPQIAANMKAMMLTTPVEGSPSRCRGAVERPTWASCCRRSRPDAWSSLAATTCRRRSQTPNSCRSRIPGASTTILDAAHISNWRSSRTPHHALAESNANTTAHWRIEATKQSRLSPSGRDGASRLARIRGRPMDDYQRRERMAQRCKVWQNGWTNRLPSVNAFNIDIQDLITPAMHWGDIWTRPHFDHRTRRVLVIGTMVALGQWDEFRLHVRAALAEGGFTPDDIKEILRCSRRSIAACRRPTTR